MAITVADVKRLRGATGTGILDAKKVLTEAEGDYEKAIKLLRISGLAKTAKRADHEATSGIIVSRNGILVQFAVETDFMAKNAEFVGLGGQIVDAAAASGAKGLEATKAAPLGSITVQKAVQSLAATIGENLSLVSVVNYDGDTHLYLHHRASDLPPRVSILVEYIGGDETFIRQVVMRIATMNPVYVSHDEVPAEIMKNERRIIEATAREEGKPEGAIPHIIEGRLDRFYKDVVLLDQPAA